MALIRQPIPNIIGGVTQQSRWIAALNQLKRQENSISDVVEGLRKRPPSQFLSKLSASTSENVFVHLMERDANNKFFLMVKPGGVVQVYDLEGNEKLVTGSFPYLNTDNPSEDLRAITVADYTFIVNRDETVLTDTAQAPSRPYEAIIYVRAGNYARTYSVVVNNQTSAFTTPDGTDASTDADKVDTAWIAGQIYNGISAAGVTKEIYGSTIYLSSDTEMTITSEDGQGNTAMKSFNGTSQRLSELPRVAKPGMVLEIEGDAGTEYDNYYVEFIKEGVWKETIKPGALLGFVASTMPHAIIRQPDDSFTVSSLTWGERQAGDDDSSPFPSFVDNKINNVFFARDRLGFLVDEGVVLSRSGEYYNFWPTTVTAVIDNDPIDVSATANQVARLEHAVPFDKDVLLCSEESQFILGSNGVLTPETVSLPPVTNYSASIQCAPEPIGRYVLFPFDRNGYSGVREYYVDSEAAGVADADEVTAHAPTYVPANPLQLTADTAENIAVLLTGDDQNTLYVYKYFWEQQQKLQNSWSKWTFPEGDTILYCKFVNRELYLVISRNHGTYLEKINLRSRDNDILMPYKVLLDQRVDQGDCSLVYSEVDDETQIFLPYEPPSNAQVVTQGNEGDLLQPGGIVWPIVRVDEQVITVDGDIRGWNFIAGVPYNMVAEPFAPTLRTSAPDGSQVSDPVAKLKVKNYEIVFQETGHFKSIFTPEGRDARTSIWNSITPGITHASVPEISSGQVRIKTTCSDDYWNLTIENDSHLPCSIINASWEAVVSSKSKG